MNVININGRPFEPAELSKTRVVFKPLVVEGEPNIEVGQNVVYAQLPDKSTRIIKVGATKSFKKKQPKSYLAAQDTIVHSEFFDNHSKLLVIKGGKFNSKDETISPVLDYHLLDGRLNIQVYDADCISYDTKKDIELSYYRVKSEAGEFDFLLPRNDKFNNTLMLFAKTMAGDTAYVGYQRTFYREMTKSKVHPQGYERIPEIPPTHNVARETLTQLAEKISSYLYKLGYNKFSVFLGVLDYWLHRKGNRSVVKSLEYREFEAFKSLFEQLQELA